MIKVDCMGCQEELKEPGGLLFSPPITIFSFSVQVHKYHLCVKCHQKVVDFMLTLRKKFKNNIDHDDKDMHISFEAGRSARIIKESMRKPEK